MDAGGTALAEEAHQAPEDKGGCPGRAAWVHESYRSSGEAEAMAYCTDPEKRGHKSRYGGSTARQPGPMSDGEMAERKKVIDGNRAWRAAREVRRKWLTDWLTRGSVPADVLHAALSMFVMAGFHGLRRELERNHATGKLLLGIKGEEPDYNGRLAGQANLVEAVMGKASPKRAQVVFVGLILGAAELACDDEAWRKPRGYKATGAYLSWLGSLGYVLSEAEQGMIAASVQPEEK
jgi:hypothetical protein